MNVHTAGTFKKDIFIFIIFNIFIIRNGEKKSVLCWVWYYFT